MRSTLSMLAAAVLLTGLGPGAPAQAQSPGDAGVPVTVVSPVRVGGRFAKTQHQHTLQDADLAELCEWTPKILAKLRELPILCELMTDQQVAGTTATLTIGTAD